MFELKVVDRQGNVMFTVIITEHMSTQMKLDMVLSEDGWVMPFYDYTYAVYQYYNEEF